LGEVSEPVGGAGGGRPDWRGDGDVNGLACRAGRLGGGDLRRRDDVEAGRRRAAEGNAGGAGEGGAGGRYREAARRRTARGRQPGDGDRGGPVGDREQVGGRGRGGPIPEGRGVNVRVGVAAEGVRLVDARLDADVHGPRAVRDDRGDLRVVQDLDPGGGG